MLRARRRDSPLTKRLADFARHTLLLTLGSALCALAVAVALFPLEAVLYTLVYAALSSRITDAVFHGLTKRQAAIIISDRREEIALDLTAVHGVGITRIGGWGGYQGTGKTILYSVINRKNMSLLKRVVLDKDPSAFVSIMTAEDVTGVEVGNQLHW